MRYDNHDPCLIVEIKSVSTVVMAISPTELPFRVGDTCIHSMEYLHHHQSYSGQLLIYWNRAMHSILPGRSQACHPKICWMRRAVCCWNTIVDDCHYQPAAAAAAVAEVLDRRPLGGREYLMRAKCLRRSPVRFKPRDMHGDRLDGDMRLSGVDR